MKRYIYTTLLVFATLFCQASGVQNDIQQPITICAKPGDTVRIVSYKDSIHKLLEIKEKEIWSGCCDEVVVDVKGALQRRGESITIEDWPAVIVNKNDAELTIEVTYERHLRCTNIPENREDAQTDASLAMWYFFGRLLSETKMVSVSTLSDTAVLVTTHKVNLTYRFGVSFPEDIRFEIIGDSCFDEDNITYLRVKDEYRLCHLKWIIPAGIRNLSFLDTIPDVLLQDKAKDYLYPIVCTATACKGETRSDTVFIGTPTPKPIMEDINCIASSENSFVAKVKDADSRLSYHWVFEESGGNRIPQSQQGDSVRFDITPNVPGRLWLTSTGGCRASDTVSRELHRSVMAGSIRLDGDTNCLFGGDSLSLVLQNAPQEHLVWRSKAGADTLLWNAGFVYRTNRTDTGILAVSVFSKYCPEDTAVATFNIRKDLAVSIDPNESCISAYTAQTFKAIGNGINLEVHWYGNGVELDTMGYPTKDSVLLRLVNPGGNNLYVAVKAKECGRESVWDTLVLRPKPEIPKLDTLWNALTPCIPLGMTDTIELRVQPQEGVRFEWDFSDDEKFYRIVESDNHSIRVATDYALFGQEEDKTISVYAYTNGCSDTLVRTETLQVIGAGLDEAWDIGSYKPLKSKIVTVGFYKSTVEEIADNRIELDTFSFVWTSSTSFIGKDNTKQTLRFMKTPPFNVACLLTNKRTSCYSYYSKTIEENPALQNIVSSSNKSDDLGAKDGTSDIVYMNTRLGDNAPDGIVLAPNPTQGNTLLYLGNTDIGERTVIEIFTEQGVCLYRQKAKGSMVELPTARFGRGLYLVRVRTGEGNPVVKKLIVQ